MPSQNKSKIELLIQMKLKNIIPLQLQIFLVCLIAIFSFSINAYHEKSEPSDGTVRSFIKMPKNSKVPVATLLDMNSKPVDLSAFKGKVVLLNIWATWCSPCLRELPALDRLQAKFDQSDFVVLPVSIDKKGIKVTLPYHKKLGLKNLEFYHDVKNNLGQFFPLDVVPATFILDRNGKPISFMRSFIDWDSDLAVKMFEYYIEQTGNSVLMWEPPKEANITK